MTYMTKHKSDHYSSQNLFLASFYTQAEVWTAWSTVALLCAARWLSDKYPSALWFDTGHRAHQCRRATGPRPHLALSAGLPLPQQHKTVKPRTKNEKAF